MKLKELPHLHSILTKKSTLGKKLEINFRRKSDQKDQKWNFFPRYFKVQFEVNYWHENEIFKNIPIPILAQKFKHVKKLRLSYHMKH